MINAVVVLKARLTDWTRSQAIPSLGTRLFPILYFQRCASGGVVVAGSNPGTGTGEKKTKNARLGKVMQ